METQLQTVIVIGTVIDYQFILLAAKNYATLATLFWLVSGITINSIIIILNLNLNLCYARGRMFCDLVFL